jgi:hypothetical protein
MAPFRRPQGLKPTAAFDATFDICNQNDCFSWRSGNESIRSPTRVFDPIRALYQTEEHPPAEIFKTTQHRSVPRLLRLSAAGASASKIGKRVSFGTWSSGDLRVVRNPECSGSPF